MHTICILLLASQAFAMDNLKVAFEWKKLDFMYPSANEKSAALESQQLIPENNLPLGLEVYQDRLFVTIPRWKPGVAASLAYIYLNDTPSDPILRPYPNWEAHRIHDNDNPEIVSPFRIRADQCGRLWVLDTGFTDIAEESIKDVTPPRLLIYDLHNDELLRSHIIPKEQRNNESFFANIVVEDHDCEDSYAYLADLNRPGLVVYSWKKQTSWLVKNNYFHFDPLAGVLNVSGIEFIWSDGIFGLALSGPDSEGYSTLYFHPMISYNEYSVSTKILRNETLANQSFQEFKFLGSRGPKSQSGASFLHKKSNVLFYALINLNAVACWRTTNPKYTMLSQGRIFMSNETMVFPNDIKVDTNDNLWVLSDKLPAFLYKGLNYNEVNFRILTAKVADAIRGTACDSKLVVSPTIMDKIMPSNNPNPVNPVSNEINNREERKSGSAIVQAELGLLLVSLFAILR
ncbi:protein yellow [Aethina tumida]|uniref:protein yellow n=1 Tax=Aethina tumida TaxID=116153 RepID=UPI00096B0E4D|nr:protein yellow [Aethina tumida]